MMRRCTAVLVTILFLSVFESCNRGKEYVTESGLKYKLYTVNDGPKARLGDYVTIEMVYRTKDDSVLFDSRKNEKPMRFKLETIPFAGAYEEGLTFLNEGDSATFYVSADSLYIQYARSVQNPVAQKHSIFSPGTYLLFDIKLLRVQNYVEAEQEYMMQLSDAEKKEKEILRRFIWDKDFKNSPDSGIYYINYLKNGEGARVDSADFVSVQYTAKFLDGKVFDYAGASGQPFVFNAGAGQVIRGLDYAVMRLREGDRAEIIFPSPFAHHDNGLIDNQNGSYIIPPFTSLWYDIEILSVQKTLQVSKR